MPHPLETELRRRIGENRYSTAYPWKPEDWAQYRQPGRLKFRKDGRVSFYIHIPFCKHLCKFCEYTRCLVPDEEAQRRYLRTVHSDIRRFLAEYPDITLEGLDIGGGTPTALSADNFAYLMRIYGEVVNSLKVSADFEPSIETSFKTITPEKIGMIREAGIRRISTGIQSLYFNRRQNDIGWRYPEADEIIGRIGDIRKAGEFKINLDFMYGFRFQNAGDMESLDRTAVEQLVPEQVTLYELRTNQLSNYESCTPELRRSQYDRWYDMLNGLGYTGRYGQNTFSTDPRDFGVSSYIRHRMLDGGDYKGFGISAQSMSGGNVEYNVGKNAADILSLIPADGDCATFDAAEHYELPAKEKFAKFVCISAYSGGFNLRIARERFYPDFTERFGDTLDFLSGIGAIEITADRINLTRRGFRHYGPILSLFYK